ncbi:MAG: lytic transglycosylase domain-containing protein [Gammaproteobacteria bacterium]|jgi:soluble lytic murein transglycosylase-like protein|nr:lytic transglycosylase domain-containing protein [Gammaproteobacteria bacterium]
MRPIINSALSRTVLMLAVLCSPTALANVSTPAAAHDPELRKLLTEAIESADSFENRFDAEVWLVDMSSRLKKFVDDEQQRLTLLRGIHREASRANLVPELVLAVIEIESHFDHFAISTAGAQGLMQVMPFWLKEIGRPDDNLVNINTNLRMGCTILRYYMDMEKNDLHKALARYNGSAGSRKYSNKVLEALRVNWHKR